MYITCDCQVERNEQGALRERVELKLGALKF